MRGNAYKYQRRLEHNGNADYFIATLAELGINASEEKMAKDKTELIKPEDIKPTEYKSVSDLVPEATKVEIEDIIDIPILILSLTRLESKEFKKLGKPAQFFWFEFQRIEDNGKGLTYGTSCGGAIVLRKLSFIESLGAGSLPIRATVTFPNSDYYDIN